ncbi:MAG: Mrp/NBP35 family ATP-binding protein [Candidatus Marsarchaeota archaeon]|jgi:Mrp family chromosome partitioning ATPase|nr:Mrp/NBP35 family ATP-binding protein [Candidatus Marsarchaeota archaeon]MCL5419157.1 Mrp/NBP35 family ATP-binding protein [Candidatus Marsarchaeota archaeon]
MAEGSGTSIKGGADITNPIMLQLLEQKRRVKEALKGVKHKIGVYSAKGGVGKTTVSVNLAYALNMLGFKVGLLDADIDCPNITMFLGIDQKYDESYPLKPVDVNGVKVISTAMFIDDIKKPVIWRGPLIAKMINEFLQNTKWEELDYLIVDLPPGTSDAPLSIMQSLDLDGFVLVTTPQHIASTNAIRSGRMAKRLGIALLGVIENMSDGSGNGKMEVSGALECEVLGSVMKNEKFNYFSDRGTVPVVNDESIKEEFLGIAKKLAHL